MQQETWRSEPSLGELFGDLARETQQLVRAEVRLAKVELKESASRLGKGAGFIGAGAILGIGATLCLLAALVALLATFMPVWVASLIVAIVIGGVGFVLARKGMGLISQADLAPRETIETVREDVVWLKKRA
jgi:hypothetical protein